MSPTKPIVLAIGGFDPSAGAGVLADVKTIEANGCYGMAAITANTFQNESEFDGLQWISAEDIIQQIEILERKHAIAAVKIGLIENIGTTEEIIRHFHADTPIVWDPVLKASAGFSFHTSIAKHRLAQLLQNITIFTPNMPEAKQIFGTNDPEEIANQAIRSNVLVKGGHASGSGADDILLADGQMLRLPGTKFDPAFAKHGTGCVLSSAIAAQLALGRSLPEACKSSKTYVERIMKSNTTLLAYH